MVKGGMATVSDEIASLSQHHLWKNVSALSPEQPHWKGRDLLHAKLGSSEDAGDSLASCP